MTWRHLGLVCCLAVATPGCGLFMNMCQTPACAADSDCGAGGQCDQARGVCVYSADSGAVDGGPNDARLADQARVDTARPDAQPDDARRPDATGTDSAVVDAADGSVPRLDAGPGDSSSCQDDPATSNVRQFFRSVGPGSVTPIVSSSSNRFDINGGRATWNEPLPDNVGVGDVIQFDIDGDGNPDKIVVIERRISNRVFLVATPDGTTAIDATETAAWSICRAYTSLANAVNLGVNPCITQTPVLVLDDVNNRTARDLVTRGAAWNIALYADQVDTGRVDISDDILTGWTTDSSHPLHIYTPTSSCEVGQSQRHRGVWSSDAYRLEVAMGDGSGSCAICARVDATIIEGLQVRMTGTAGAHNLDAISLDPSGTAATILHRVSHNLVNAEFTTGALAIMGIVAERAGTYRIWNNIVYTHSYQNSMWIGIRFSEYADANNVVRHNTVRGWRYGLSVYGTATNSLHNNLAVDNEVDYLGDTNALSLAMTGANISSDASSPNFAYQNSYPTFVNLAVDNLHLDTNDGAARERGLVIDNPVVVDDIDGEPRPQGDAPDIGADEAR